MKKTPYIVMVTMFLFVFSGAALAGQWVNPDMRNSQVWVDTSHWENHQYQAWVDTSHWEWRSWSVWGVVGQHQEYWETGWVRSGYSHEEWGYLERWDGADFYNVLRNRGVQRCTDWVNANLYPDHTALGVPIFTKTYTWSYYGPYNNGDGSSRQLRRLWTSVGWYSGITYKWNSYSDWYETNTYGYNTVYDYGWIPKSGWVWVSSGYMGTFDNWVWVNSGYMDVAHGSVTFNKTPNFVFTKNNELNDGDLAHMDISIQWSGMNHNVKSVESFHLVNRYKNNGQEVIYPVGTYNPVIGVNGSIQYRYEYPHGAMDNSPIYFKLNFDNGTSVLVYANIPVNPVLSTRDLTAADPVWHKSFLNTETINF